MKMNEEYEFESNSKDPILVTEHTMASVIGEWSGIPIGKLKRRNGPFATLEFDMTCRVMTRSSSCAVVWLERSVVPVRDLVGRPVASLSLCVAPPELVRVDCCDGCDCDCDYFVPGASL
jgi:hypothetical protein